MKNDQVLCTLNFIKNEKHNGMMRGTKDPIEPAETKISIYSLSFRFLNCLGTMNRFVV